MINYERLFTVRYLHESEKLSGRAIARRLGLHRKTVARYVRMEVPGPEECRPKGSVCSPFRTSIIEGLQRGLSLANIHRSLTRTQGFTGGYTSLKNYVRHEGLGRSPKEIRVSAWMFDVLQGTVRCEELEQMLDGKLSSGDVASLREVILTRSLRYRNRAMVVLASKLGIPQRTIADTLSIHRRTIRACNRTFEEGGVEALIAAREGVPGKCTDPQYIDAVFTILHAPPSCHNVNRTTWTLPLVSRIMAAQGTPASRHAVGKIIKTAGYRTRKAKKVLTSNDPAYREKLQAITTILSNLGPTEKFFSIDEFGPFAVKVQGGRSLVPPGETRTFCPAPPGSGQCPPIM